MPKAKRSSLTVIQGPLLGFFTTFTKLSNKGKKNPQNNVKLVLRGQMDS